MVGALEFTNRIAVKMRPPIQGSSRAPNILLMFISQLFVVALLFGIGLILLVLLYFFLFIFFLSFAFSAFSGIRAEESCDPQHPYFA